MIKPLNVEIILRSCYFTLLCDSERQSTGFILFLFSSNLPVDVLLGGHAPPLVDPLLQLCHGALPLCHPLCSCPGHKAPHQHQILLLLSGRHTGI